MSFRFCDPPSGKSILIYRRCSVFIDIIFSSALRRSFVENQTYLPDMNYLFEQMDFHPVCGMSITFSAVTILRLRRSQLPDSFSVEILSPYYPPLILPNSSESGIKRKIPHFPQSTATRSRRFPDVISLRPSASFRWPPGCIMEAPSPAAINK